MPPPDFRSSRSRASRGTPLPTLRPAGGRTDVTRPGPLLLLRPPAAPTSLSAGDDGGPASGVVGKAMVPHGIRIEQVPAIDDEGVGHGVLQSSQVEGSELV